ETQTVELQTTPSAYLQFQLKAQPSSKSASAKTSTSTSNLNVPPAAQKEFDQASKLLAAGTKEGSEQAIQHLEKAVALYPQFIEAELKLGAVYMDLRQWDKAEAALMRTLNLDPKVANAYFALGEVYRRQKKFDQAEK